MISLKESIILNSFKHKENEKLAKQDEQIFSKLEKYQKTPYVYNIDGIEYVLSLEFADEGTFEKPYFPRVWDNDLNSFTDNLAKFVKVGESGVFLSCLIIKKDEKRPGKLVYDIAADDVFCCSLKDGSRPEWFEKAAKTILSIINPNSDYVTGKLGLDEIG